MRHQIFGRKLARGTKLRKRLLRTLVTNFLLSDKLSTTTARAKAIRPLVEHLVTKAKPNNLIAKHYLYTKIPNKKVVEKFLEMGVFFKDQPGGYLKLLKLGRRSGDDSEQTLILWSKMPEAKSEVAKKIVKEEKKTVKKEVVKKAVKKEVKKAKK